MGTNVGGGVVDGRARRFQARILVPGWNPNPDANLFFANFCIQIDQCKFIQLYKLYYKFIQLYKLYSTNSYNSYIFYTNCILRIHTTTRGRSPSRERAVRAARAKPEHTSCPDQAAPGCPDVRVHPAAPTLGYTRLPRPLGYTRLPRSVRVCSWGGWVRNGIKITIRKLRLYKFIRVAYYSQPLRKYGIISGNYHKQICWAYSKLQEKVG
jgi:hypothetical protein